MKFNRIYDTGTIFKITGLTDGYIQYLDHKSLVHWSYRSAFFTSNSYGDSILLQIMGTDANFIYQDNDISLIEGSSSGSFGVNSQCNNPGNISFNDFIWLTLQIQDSYLMKEELRDSFQSVVLLGLLMTQIIAFLLPDIAFLVIQIGLESSNLMFLYLMKMVQ